VRRIERVFWGAEADRLASVVDHERLIAAFAARDAALAEAELARNWERGLSWINPAIPATTVGADATSSIGSK
jgi:DNA-binding GntR family transcriptional regulator